MIITTITIAILITILMAAVQGTIIITADTIARHDTMDHMVGQVDGPAIIPRLVHTTGEGMPRGLMVVLMPVQLIIPIQIALGRRLVLVLLTNPGGGLW